MKLNDAFVQVVMVGVAALCCPGLFNSLTGLGKAGSSDPKYAAQANMALYLVFGVFGYFGGAFFNILGHRILIAVGGLFYGLYALGMYLASNYSWANEWVPWVVGILLGFGAAWFWTAQGTMMLAYATSANKGKYITMFWVIFNFGGMFGGILQMAVNWNAGSTETQANAASYFVFIALMVLGAIIVPFFLVPAHKVEKEDGTMVKFEVTNDWKEQIIGSIKASMHPKMLLLCIFFLGSNWYYTYQFNFVNGLFTMRTRGFNSALYWGAQMLGAFITGQVCDWSSFNYRQRAMAGWLLSTLLFVVAWSGGAWVQYGFEGGYEKDRAPLPLVDMTESSRATGVVICYMLYGLADASLQAFSYWIMGAVAGSDIRLASRFTGFYKGVQSFGAAGANAFEIPSGDSAVAYGPQFWTGFGIWAVGCLLAFFAAWGVDPNPPSEEVSQVYMKSASVLNSTGEVAIQRSLSMRGSSHHESDAAGKLQQDLEEGVASAAEKEPPTVAQ